MNLFEMKWKLYIKCYRRSNIIDLLNKTQYILRGRGIIKQLTLFTIISSLYSYIYHIIYYNKISTFWITSVHWIALWILYKYIHVCMGLYVYSQSKLVQVSSLLNTFIFSYRREFCTMDLRYARIDVKDFPTFMNYNT